MIFLMIEIPKLIRTIKVYVKSLLIEKIIRQLYKIIVLNNEIYMFRMPIEVGVGLSG